MFWMCDQFLLASFAFVCNTFEYIANTAIIDIFWFVDFVNVSITVNDIMLYIVVSIFNFWPLKKISVLFYSRRHYNILFYFQDLQICTFLE